MADKPHAYSIFRGFLFAVAVGVLSYLYLIYHKTPQGEAKRLENVLLRLLAEEQAANVSTDLVIAVGFGSCLDLLVDGIPLMKALDIKPPSKAKYHEDISTLQELSEMFAFFLEQGAAVE